MNARASSLLSCTDLTVRVPGRLLVDKLELELRSGEFLAVLGQNGAGKTLTMMTLAGLRNAGAGHVLLNSNDIHAMPRSQVAKQLALLPQVMDDAFPATVMDTALIGRHPHIGRFEWESADDKSITARALANVGLADLADRDIFTLSGGERRRLAIAQVLAQTPKVFLLDEPSNHLDPHHQLDALQVFRRAANNGAAVIANLHDVNLAVRFADRCLLLFGDGRWQLGDRDEVLTRDTLSELYATTMEPVSWRSHELFVASP